MRLNRVVAFRRELRRGGHQLGDRPGDAGLQAEAHDERDQRGKQEDDPGAAQQVREALVGPGLGLEVQGAQLPARLANRGEHHCAVRAEHLVQSAGGRDDLIGSELHVTRDRAVVGRIDGGRHHLRVGVERLQRELHQRPRFRLEQRRDFLDQGFARRFQPSLHVAAILVEILEIKPDHREGQVHAADQCDQQGELPA
jgi:hypothetical protein